MHETHDDVIRAKHLPKVGQSVRSRKYGTSWRVIEKKEACCRESDVGKKETVYSLAADGSIIGFEILNFLGKRERRPSKNLPVKTRILLAS